MIVEIAAFIEDIYQQRSTFHSRFYYSFLCQKYVKRSELIVKVAIISYLSFHVVFVLLFLLDSLYNAKMVPIFRFYLPGIDGHSIGGAILLNAFNYVVILFGDLIICSFTLIFMIFTNMPMVPAVMTDLQEAVLSSVIKKRFIQIILMYIKYNEYVFGENEHSLNKTITLMPHIFLIFRNIRELDRAFFKSCLCQIVTSSTVSVAGLFISQWVTTFKTFQNIHKLVFLFIHKHEIL